METPDLDSNLGARGSEFLKLDTQIRDISSDNVIWLCDYSRNRKKKREMALDKAMKIGLCILAIGALVVAGDYLLEELKGRLK